MTPPEYLSALSDHYGPLDIDFDEAAGSFVGKFAFRRLGWGSIARMYTNTGHHSLREAGQASERDSCFTLTLLEEGAYEITQRGRVADCRANEICLLAPGVPFEGYGRGTVKALSINLPGRVARAQFPAIDSACSKAIPSGAGDGAIIRDIMLGIWRENGALGTNSVNRLITCLLSLLASAFFPEDGAEQQGSSLEYHFTRIRRFIDEEFANPDISCDLISSELRMSRSYVYAATQWAGTTVGRLVQERRLEECRRMLSNPSLAELSITSIAFAAGFESLSHFSRRFSEKFGTTAKKYRAHMQQP